MEGKDPAKPHEFDESVAGSACHFERSESEFASFEKRTQSRMKQRLKNESQIISEEALISTKKTPPNMRQHLIDCTQSKPPQMK